MMYILYINIYFESALLMARYTAEGGPKTKQPVCNTFHSHSQILEIIYR
jgi:hypothetical protein